MHTHTYTLYTHKYTGTHVQIHTWIHMQNVLLHALLLGLYCTVYIALLTFHFSALLFSATFRKRVERVARDILTDPLRVVQGDIGEVRELIAAVVGRCNTAARTII